ncbi:MAG TPA: hypothetical protein VFQ34_11830 [Nitrospiraceae bacterium]|nr:hypothetical protein [Nitrospiraceae bacterium]
MSSRPRHVVEQLFGNGYELEPLLDDVDRDEEVRGDLFLAQALLAQVPEGAELVERMLKKRAGVLDPSILLGRDVAASLAHDAGHQRDPGEPLLLGEEFERPVRPPAAGISNMSVLLPSSSTTGRTLRLEALQEAARAISSASSSIETPTLTRRTLD